MVGLVDCNNFYVSCERVFHPALRNRPVVVLSNNDGCVISRSNEAKTMGIKMGVPFFQVKPLVDAGRLDVFSSNFTLYGDMSRRVMSVLRSEVPFIEVYSIDECFIDVEGIPRLAEFGRHLSRKVRKWTGIPVSVGLAPTMTLAKMASKFAKKYSGYKGSCIIDTDEKRLKALRLFDIADVWGIGRRYAELLAKRYVKTAYDFTQWPKARVEHLMGISGVRTWMELQGKPCHHLEPSVGKKTITTSRSFKEEIYDYPTLASLVADFAAHCARKLREQKGSCQDIFVYIHTNRFHEDDYYGKTARVHLLVPSSDVRELAAAATEGLKSIFVEGYGYKKAGVTVTNIVNGSVPTDMFDDKDRIRQERLLRALDNIRLKHGDRTIRVASQGDSSGEMNRKYRSQCYTTNPDDIIEVKTS